MFGMSYSSKYVIMHIPKTAGTSLHSVLQKLFKKKNVSPLFGAYKMSMGEARVLRKYRMICGHISWVDVKEYFGDRKTITFLRDPLDRCVSWYYYAKSRPLDAIIPLDEIKYINSPAEAISLAKQLDIDEFFRQEHPHITQNICNRQVWQIGDHADVENRSVSDNDILKKALLNLDSINFIGFSESFNRDVSCMATEFELGDVGEIPFTNRSDSRISVSQLPSQVICRLEDLNRLDIEMCEKARSKFGRITY